MSKKKMADSIIIRVGGGIREVSREPIELIEKSETVHRDPDFEQTEDVPPFGVELTLNKKMNPDKIIN